MSTTDILLNLAVGFGFGFTLERAGFGDSRRLAAQFYFHDQTVLKVMFTSIVVAMVLIFWSNALGIVSFDALFVNPTHLWPGIVGGLLVGAGFIVGGFCPGTSMVAASTLKMDAFFFLFGLAGGVLLFGETAGLYTAFFDEAGFLGRLTLFEWLGVDAGVVALLVVLMALGMFWGAELLEKVFSRAPKDAEA